MYVNKDLLDFTFDADVSQAGQAHCFTDGCSTFKSNFLFRYSFVIVIIVIVMADDKGSNSFLYRGRLQAIFSVRRGAQATYFASNFNYNSNTFLLI